MNTKLDDVKNFWNLESCGERYTSDVNKFEFYKQQSTLRYELEPYIKDFAEFKKFKDFDVLEIGVGMGSDHFLIAENKPKSLTGIDLTERAISHTKDRFDLFNFKSLLKTDNAEKLSFEDKSFDKIYSWGVLHHSPNTKKCFEEVWRVLRPNGIAKIMVYHKYSLVGLMLWTRYGLLKMNPFISISSIYSKYLESPGTKAYSIKEIKKILKEYKIIECKVQLSFSDLLEGDVGQRHKGRLLSIIKIIYPKFLIKIISKIIPIGLYLLITVQK